MTIILVAALLTLAAAGALATQAFYAPAEARRRLLMGIRPLEAPSEPELDGFRTRVLVPLQRALARLALRLGRKTTMDDVRTRLQAAGLARRISPVGFLAAKVLLAIGGLLLGGLAAALVGSGIRSVLLAAVLAFGGLFLPEFLLSRRATARLARVDAALPKAIDLLAVSVEAGLGFDAALAKLVERLRGPLAEEFTVMLSEMRVGAGRATALRRLAARLPSPALTSFVHALVRADQLGISMAKILRSQAEELRDKQRAAAEEKAMKAPVKMLFPTVIFIFPVMFVVVLAPALLTIRGSFLF